MMSKDKEQLLIIVITIIFLPALGLQQKVQIGTTSSYHKTSNGRLLQGHHGKEQAQEGVENKYPA